MSANVWFEEVDTALLTEIGQTVKYKDANGILIPLSTNENALIVRKPEEDFKLEIFPCVSIYNIASKFDPMRYSAEGVEIARDEETHKLLMEEPATPFNLTYQIDFWAKYSDDMNTMLRTWLVKHFRQFNLNVTDDGGVLRSCNCIIYENPKKSDLVLNKERLFHSIISYQIWVELDDETRYNVSMATDREFGINSTDDAE